MHFNADWRMIIRMCCSLKAERLRCLGMGLLSAMLQSCDAVDESSQKPFLFCFFVVFFVSLKRSINMTLQRPTDLSETNRHPITSCVSPPVLDTSCYSCSCHSDWVTTKCWTRTHWNRIYLLKRKCLFLYVLMRTSTPPTTKHMTNVLHEVTDSAYLARGCTFLGLELRYVLTVYARFKKRKEKKIPLIALIYHKKYWRWRCWVYRATLRRIIMFLLFLLISNDYIIWYLIEISSLVFCTICLGINCVKSHECG